jgi:hypothetical protein
VHVDLVGPLPVSEDNQAYIMTIIDRTSRWAEAVPLTNVTAEKCADAFVETWVAQYGVPRVVTTDKGSQFTSAAWACMAKAVGFQHVTTSAYHPQANGLVERFHRQPKAALHARLCVTAWANHLAWVMLGLRAAPKEDSNVSAAEVIFGKKLVLPGEFVPPPGARTGAPARPAVRERSYAEVTKGPVLELSAAEYVYDRRGGSSNPMQPPYDGPYRVLHCRSKVYTLQVGSWQEDVVVGRLKPHAGAEPAAVGQPTRRGRPPGTGGQADRQPPPPVSLVSWGGACGASKIHVSVINRGNC